MANDLALAEQERLKARARDTKRREKKKARRQELKFQVETDPQAAAERASNRRLKHPFSIPGDGLEPRFWGSRHI